MHRADRHPVAVTEHGDRLYVEAEGVDAHHQLDAIESKLSRDLKGIVRRLGED